jgi:hypothetical protein
LLGKLPKQWQSEFVLDRFANLQKGIARPITTPFRYKHQENLERLNKEFERVLSGLGQKPKIHIINLLSNQ